MNNLEELKKLIASIIVTIMVFSSYLLLPVEQNESYAEVIEDLDFSVNAECETHAKMNTASTINLRLIPATTLDSSMLTGILTIPGQPVETSINYRWDFPKKSSVSVLFEGPKVSANYYCMSPQDTKNVFLSYSPSPELQISASKYEEFSQDELEDIQYNQKLKSHSTIEPTFSQHQDEGILYEIGKGTERPYWLTVSVPVNISKNFQSVLKFELE